MIKTERSYTRGPASHMYFSWNVFCHDTLSMVLLIFQREIPVIPFSVSLDMETYTVRYTYSRLPWVFTWKRTIRTERRKVKYRHYFDGSIQDWSNSIAKSLELLQSCTKPSIYNSRIHSSPNKYLGACCQRLSKWSQYIDCWHYPWIVNSLQFNTANSPR